MLSSPAREIDLHRRSQLRQRGVVVHRQRLFDPVEAEPVHLAAEGESPLEAPLRNVADHRHPPRLVGVDAQPRRVTHQPARLAHLGEVLLQGGGVHAQLHRVEALAERRGDALGVFGPAAHLAQRGVELHLARGGRVGREEPPHGELARLAQHVPAGGLDPPQPLAEVAHLAQPLPDARDVVGALAQQVRTQQAAQALALVPHRRTGAEALQPARGAQTDEGEPVLRLGEAGDPRRVEGPGKRDLDVPQVNLGDAHGAPVRLAAPSPCAAPSARAVRRQSTHPSSRSSLVQRMRTWK